MFTHENMQRFVGSRFAIATSIVTLGIGVFSGAENYYRADEIGNQIENVGNAVDLNSTPALSQWRDSGNAEIKTRHDDIPTDAFVCFMGLYLLGQSISTRRRRNAPEESQTPDETVTA